MPWNVFADTAPVGDPTTTFTLGGLSATLVGALVWALKTQFGQSRELRAAITANTSALRRLTAILRRRPCLRHRRPPIAPDPRAAQPPERLPERLPPGGGGPTIVGLPETA